MIINEDILNDLDIEEDDIDNIIFSEDEEKTDLSSYTHVLNLQYDISFEPVEAIQFAKKIIRNAELVIDNTELLSDSYLFLSVLIYNDIETSDEPITSQNCEQIMRQMIGKNKGRVKVSFYIKFKPVKIEFKQFCDEMYIFFIRLIRNKSCNEFSITDEQSGRYHNVGSHHYVFYSRDVMKLFYMTIFNLNYLNFDYGKMTNDVYVKRYECSGKMPYIINLVKLARKSDIFSEYKLDIKGHYIHSAGDRGICIGLIPKSEEYNKTGLMLDFIYKQIICRFTSYDYEEFEVFSNFTFMIYVLIDYDNVELTNSKYLCDNEKLYGYIYKGKVKMDVRLINKDWRLIDVQTGKLLPFLALREETIQNIQQRFKQDLQQI